MHHRTLLVLALLALGSAPAVHAAEGTITVMARVIDSGPGVLADRAGQEVLAGGPADQMLSDGMARIRLELAPADGWPGPARVTVEFVAN